MAAIRSNFPRSRRAWSISDNVGEKFLRLLKEVEPVQAELNEEV